MEHMLLDLSSFADHTTTEFSYLADIYQASALARHYVISQILTGNGMARSTEVSLHEQDNMFV